MLEWFSLILLIPLILVPIVLVFGFAGCNWVYGLDETRLPSVTTFETVLGEDIDRRNRCIVQRIVKLDKGGSKVTITVQRPAMGTLALKNLFISRASQVNDPSRDPYDSADDLTPVLSNEIQLTPDPNSPLLELPEIDYTLDNAQPLLIAFDIGADGSVPRTAMAVPAFEATAYVGPLNEASFADPDADRQSGYDAQPRVYLIQRIAVR